MGAANALASAETHNMVLIHNVFRREFRLLGDLIAAVPIATPAGPGNWRHTLAK